MASLEHPSHPAITGSAGAETPEPGETVGSSVGRLRSNLASGWQAAGTLAGVWVVVALGATLGKLLLAQVQPNDFWWHARVGEIIVQTRSIPRTDLFSFTRAGAPWACQSWLMEVAFYILLRVGDLPLVILFHSLAIWTAYVLLFVMSLHSAQGSLRLAAFATLGAVAVGLSNWAVRPQTISFPLFVTVLYLLERAERSARARGLWLLPLLFALWANSHGGFVFGLVLVGGHVAARLLTWLRREGGFPLLWAGVGLLCVAATFVNPLGVGTVDYVLGFARHPITQMANREFAAPTLRDPAGQTFFPLVAAVVSTLLVAGYRPRGYETLRMLLFAALGLMAVRNVAWFGVVAAPTFARALAQWADLRGGSTRNGGGTPAVNYALSGLVFVLCTASLPWLRSALPLPEQRRSLVSPDTPVGVVDYLRQLDGEHRVFHSMLAGSVMIWATPDVPVFIDPRIELYPVEQWEDYSFAMWARHDWQEILDRYGVDVVVLESTEGRELATVLTESTLWRLDYRDAATVAFRR